MVSRKDCSVNIMDLNDDCLEFILRKLNHFEQFRISKVHARFKTIVKRMWRLSAIKVLVISEYFSVLEETRVLVPSLDFAPTGGDGVPKEEPEASASKGSILSSRSWSSALVNRNAVFDELPEFILAVAPFMQHLVMHHMPVEELRKMSHLKLPSVLVFEWIADSGKEFEQLLDEDILMIRTIFPNLQKLKLKSCQITGKYLADVFSLQKLSLDDCHYLESEYFRDVFHYLRLKKFDIMDDCDELNCCDLAELRSCPTLEHIKIADYHLCLEPYILNNILNMPNLSKLSIYSRNFVFDVLERVARNPIKSIEAFKYNGVLVHTERFFSEVGHMKHLKQLYFFECCTFEDYERIHDHCCASVSKQLTELREVHFIACIIESEEGLLQFVNNCRDLELINVSNASNIGNSFVWRCLDLLKKQTWRYKPLKLWTHKTSIDKCIAEDPRILCNSNLLKIDFTKKLVNANPPGVLKFMFHINPSQAHLST